MAIYRYAADVTGSANGADTFTLTIKDAPIGSLVVVGVGDSNATVTHVTPTSSHLTFTRQVSAGISGAGVVEMYTAPVTTALLGEVITCTASPAGNFPQINGWANVYRNASETVGTPVDVNTGSNGATSTTPTVSITTVQNGDLIVSNFGIGANSTLTVDANSKLVSSLLNGGSAMYLAHVDWLYPAPPQSNTLNGTLGGSFSYRWVAIAIKGNNATRINTLRPAIFRPGLAR